MEYGAIDLHLRRSQFRIVREDGAVVKDGKFDTTRADFTRVFGDRARDAHPDRKQYGERVGRAASRVAGP